MVDFQKLRQKEKYKNLVFSQSAAARILGISAFDVIQIQRINENTYKVWTKDDRTFDVSDKCFYQDFSNSRKARSRSLELAATDYPNVYIVTNPESKKRYPVRYTNTGIECKCRDYQKQIEILGRGCCKHGYRLLHQLGYGDLQSYLDGRVTIAV